MDGAIVEFSQIFILYSKRKIQHHQKKLLEKQTKRFPTKLFDFLFHIVLKYTLLWKYYLSVFIKSLYFYAMLWTAMLRLYYIFTVSNKLKIIKMRFSNPLKWAKNFIIRK